MRAEKAMLEKDAVIKMLEAENKHLSSMVDESLASQYVKDMYESAPQKRTAKHKHDSKMLKCLHGSIGDSHVAPIVVRMPNNARVIFLINEFSALSVLIISLLFSWAGPYPNQGS